MDTELISRRYQRRYGIILLRLLDEFLCKGIYRRLKPVSSLTLADVQSLLNVLMIQPEVSTWKMQSQYLAKQLRKTHPSTL